MQAEEEARKKREAEEAAAKKKAEEAAVRKKARLCTDSIACTPTRTHALLHEPGRGPGTEEA